MPPAKGNEARRHHFVPQFYLRNFARDGKIGSANLQSRKVFTQVVRKAASVNDFHSLPGHPEGTDAFEKVLSKVESSAAKVIAQVSGQGIRSLSPGQRSELAFFSALQYARSPNQRRSMESIRAEMIRLEVGFGGRHQTASWAEENLGLTNASEETIQQIWDEATRPGGPPTRVSPAEHISQLSEIVEELWTYLVGRPILHVRFERRSLLTSDSPVGLIPRGEELLEPLLGVSFRTAWGGSFPLSRRNAILYGDIDTVAQNTTFDQVALGKYDLEAPASTAMAKLLNFSTARNSSEWLYFHPDDEHLLPSPLPDPQSSAIRTSGANFDFDRVDSVPDGNC